MAAKDGDETSCSTDDLEDDTTSSGAWTAGINYNSSKVEESPGDKRQLSKVEEEEEKRTNADKEDASAFGPEGRLASAISGEEEHISSKFVDDNNIDDILEKINRLSQAGEAFERALEDPSLNESILISVLERAAQGSNVNMNDLRTLPGPSSKREEDDEQAKINDLLADLSSHQKTSTASPPTMNLDLVLQEYDQLEKSLLEDESDGQDDFDLSVVSKTSSLTRSQAEIPQTNPPATKVPPKPTPSSSQTHMSSPATPTPAKPPKKSNPTSNTDDRPLSVRSSQSSPILQSGSPKKSPLKFSRRGSRINTTGFKEDQKENEERIHTEKIAQLEKEVARQDTLIGAFQEENASLCKQLKAKEGEWKNRVEELESLVGSLKTEIATLKIARLSGGSPGKRPSSAESAKLLKELERVNLESQTKSFNIQELRKEVIQLQNKLNEAFKKPQGDKEKAEAALEEKNKLITQLERRVRTLQKILYTKNGGGEGMPAELLNNPMDFMSPKKSNYSDGNGHVLKVLQSRVADLERSLGAADAEAKGKLQEFNAKLNALKGKYEDQLQETESKLQEAERRLKISEDSSGFEKTQTELRTRLEKTQAEVLQWRQENLKLKRDLELRDKALHAAEKKTVITSTAASQGDAGTLALALKRFRREMAEKDKEVLKLRKEANEFKKTNTTLKKEREKLLLLQQGFVQSAGNVATFGGSALKKSTVPSAEIQLVLEREREEYGRLLDAKGTELEKKSEEIRRLERFILDLQSRQPPDPLSRHQIQMDRSSPSFESQFKIDQLESRLETQNTLIARLRDHLKVFQGIDIQALKEDNHRLKEEVRNLRKRLEIADSLKRPENEVLDVLSRKLELLEGRYLEREKTLENLLRRAACKVTTGGGGSTSGRSQWGDMCELSPTTMSLTLLSSRD